MIFLLASPAISQNNGPIYKSPFSSNSIWNRVIAKGATYHDVSEAIWGKPSLAPNRVSVEQVTIIYYDETQPIVNVVKSKGWYVPGRADASLQVFYTTRIAHNAGIEVRYPSTGNASFVIINKKTNIASEGSAGWREPGGDLITFYNDKRIHNINLYGNGLSGTLGSGLPALGGLLRQGEINDEIKHSLAIALSSRNYSRTNQFIAPAWRADSFASSIIHGYFGKNPSYSIGTLLAIPYNIDINQIKWNTKQGYIMAKANQKYGWYIIDSNDGGLGDDQMKFNISRETAIHDFGLGIDPKTDKLYVKEQKIDVVGLEADVIQILKLVMATTK